MGTVNHVSISAVQLLQDSSTRAAGIALATAAAANAETSAIVCTILGYGFAVAGGIVLVGAGIYLTILMIKKARATQIHGA